MEIEKNKQNGLLTLTLSGNLNTQTAPELEQVIKAELSGVSSLVIDLAKVSYISSAGLRVLLATQNQMNEQGRMVVKNVGPEVMEVFDMTGFSDVLTLE